MEQVQSTGRILRYAALTLRHTRRRRKIRTRAGASMKWRRSSATSSEADGNTIASTVPTTRSNKSHRKKSKRIMQRLFCQKHSNDSSSSSRSHNYPTSRRNRREAIELGLDDCSHSSQGESNQMFLLKGLPRHPAAHSSCSYSSKIVSATTLSRSRHHRKSVLEQAIANGCSPAAWKTLLDRFVSRAAPTKKPYRNHHHSSSKAACTGIIHSFKATGFVLDLNRARMVAQLLPYIQCLEVRPTSYTSSENGEGGLIYLLAALQNPSNTKHLKEVKLLQLPSKLMTQDPRLCHAFKSMLRGTATIILRLQISLHQEVANPFHVANQFQQNGLAANSTSFAPDDTACFQAIQEAFSAAPGGEGKAEAPVVVEVLELIDFFVQAEDFQRFLANNRNPKLVRIRRFRFSATRITIADADNIGGGNDHNSSLVRCTPQVDEATATVNRIDYSRASIESLAMSGCALAFECVDEVITSIATLPNLEHLTFSVWKHVPSTPRRLYYLPDNDTGPQQYYADYNYETVDITEGVVVMLLRNRIQSISSMTAHVEMSHMCRALAINTSLKVMHLNCGVTNHQWTVKDEACLLQVLEEGGNTTLADVTRISCPRVRHYAALNEYGRGRARNLADTTPKAFVGLLEKVNTSPSFEREQYRMKYMNNGVGTGNNDTGSARSAANLERHRVLYGLLKENPNLWC